METKLRPVPKKMILGMGQGCMTMIWILAIPLFLLGAIVMGVVFGIERWCEILKSIWFQYEDK